MENELTAAVTAKTAAHAELAAARVALRDAKRAYHVAATRLRNNREADDEWTAHLRADAEAAGSELDEAKQRLADAGTLMQRASDLTKPFLKGST